LNAFSPPRNSSRTASTMAPANTERQGTLVSPRLRRATLLTDAPPHPQDPTTPTNREPVDAELSPSTPRQPVPSGTAALLELSSSAAAAPKDRLSSMPPELLSRVFAHSDYSKPISGPLLYYTRANLYHCIIINTGEQLQALCDASAMDPKFGEVVWELHLHPRWRPTEDTGESSDPTEEELASLYRSLKKVERMSVEGRWADLILSHNITSNCFPHLQSLHLGELSMSCAGSLLAWNSCIKHYSKLATLSVDVSSLSWDGSRKRGGTVKCPQTRSGGVERSGVGSAVERKEDCSIDELLLVACFPRDAVFQFFQRFGSITRLRLHHFGRNDAQFNTFLSPSDRASSIKHLELLQDHQHHQASYNWGQSAWNSHPDISQNLHRFTALESLVLKDTKFTLTTLFQHLRDPLPLSRLEFIGETTPIDTDDLKALFLPGPGRLSTLKSLTLNILDPGRVGTRVHSAGPMYALYNQPRPHQDWTMPDWVPGVFEYEGAEEVLSLAKKAGVEVFGSVMDAVEVQREWYKDVDEAENWEWETNIDLSDSSEE
jgi:hypothetical protein